MKSYYSFLIISIMLICSTPSISFGDIITKDGVKIQFFKRGQKKSIPESELKSKDGVISYENEYIEKIVFSGGSGFIGQDSPTYTVKVFLKGKTLELVLRKDKISSSFSKKETFSLPLYPWINEVSMVTEKENEEDPYTNGVYLIVIERIKDSKSEKVIDITYSIHESMVD